MKFYITLLMLTWCIVAGAQADAIRALQKSLATIQDSARYADALNRLALLLYEQNADSTLYYANEARGVARRLNYPQGIADATNNFGIVFDIKGNTPLALRYYNDAYNQYMALGDSSNIAQTLMNIAMVYNLNGNTDKAIANYKRAYALGSRLAYDSIMSLVIYNYILQFPGEFRQDSIDAYINKAVSIATKYNDTRLLLAIGQLKANNYIKNGDTATGISLLQTALAGGLRQKLYYMSLDILMELGDLFKDTDSTKAVAYYNQALILTQQKGYQSYLMNVAQKLYDFYAIRHNTAQAYYYSRQLFGAYVQRDSINNNSGIDYIEYALKDQQLESLQLKAVYSTRLLWLAVAIALLAIAIIFIQLGNRRRTKKTHTLLQRQFTQLETTSNALETSNQNYARLIKIVAHDLRNPIGAITSISSLLLNNEHLTTEDKEWVGMMGTAGNRCLQLIGEMLETDFTIGDEVLHKTPFNLDELLKQIVELLEFRAKEKKQQLILQNQANRTIAADRDKLSRVLDNLVVNAIKFSKEGSTITIEGNNTDEGVVIAVKDTGMGIPEDIAGKLFDPFSNAKRKGTAGEQSFGLGLYICKQIVEAHGGRIWFESEAGKGATFFILLK